MCGALLQDCLLGHMQCYVCCLPGEGGVMGMRRTYSLTRSRLELIPISGRCKPNALWHGAALWQLAQAFQASSALEKSLSSTLLGKAEQDKARRTFCCQGHNRVVVVWPRVPFCQRGIQHCWLRDLTQWATENQALSHEAVTKHNAP